MDEPSVTRASLPKGYSFVPKGNVFITGNCRRHTYAASRTVYVVFKSIDLKEKIGIGVPTNIYFQVQLDERNTRAERATNVLKRDANIAKEFEKSILKVYPRIPPSEVSTVLERALEKGKGKVGRTSTLDVTYKVILAVRAHIRHQKTDYHMLLRGGMERDVARKEVEAEINRIGKAWGRVEARFPRRQTRKQQLPQPKPVARRTATSSKSRSTVRPLMSTSAHSTLSRDSDLIDQNKRDATVNSAAQKLGETRCRGIGSVIAHIRGLGQKLRSKKPKRDAIRTYLILKHFNTVNKLLEEVGLQRVENPEAMENLAKQLGLNSQDPTVEPQLTTPEITSTHQMETRHPSPRGKSATEQEEQEISLANTGSADVQREAPYKTKVVIDLTGDSEDEVVSIYENTKTPPKRNKEASRVPGVTRRRDSDATARELRRELRELGIGDTGQALPRKRQAAVEANRVLSERFHRRKAK